MYPVIARIGTFEITSFGLLVGIAALVALWLFGRECRRSGLPEAAVNAAIGGVLGGLFGAKLLWTIEFSGTAPLASLFFSRGGLSWFGGLLGGVGTGIWLLRRGRVPIMRAVSAATPALAIGHAIGRVGCFLVGDDYGRPTDLPWGVAFPLGLPPTEIPVHPTQLYETALLVPLGVLLIWCRRRGWPDRRVVGLYLVAAGAIRFGIEFLRVNLPILGSLTLAQLIAGALMLVGVGLLMTGDRRKEIGGRR
jgi:phosphatidylglycerol:prolipoprotein diacylglycerol transferase